MSSVPLLFMLFMYGSALIIPPMIVGFLGKSVWRSGSKLAISLVSSAVCLLILYFGYSIIAAISPIDLLTATFEEISRRDKPDLVPAIVFFTVVPLLFQLFSSSLVGACTAERVFGSKGC